MSEEAQAQQDLPLYVIEGARSGRSRCKSCRRAISKGALRLGVLIEGPYGKGYLWHHLSCAARHRFDSVEEAYGLEAWKEAKEPPEPVPRLDDLRKMRQEAEDRRKSRMPIPHVELAPSGRAKCKHCDRPIDKGTLRVVLGRGVYFGSQVRTAPINVHPHCVPEAIRAEDCTTKPTDFADAIRSNSAGVPTERIEALLERIGELN